jgi:hypothetical protein
MTESNNDQKPPELTLETVVEVEPDKITPEQKTFLESNKDNLTPDQAEKFGISKEETPIDPEKVEIETRFKSPEPKKIKEEDNEVDPDDEVAIGKVVDKKTAELRQTVEKQRDESEVNALLIAKPEFIKYKGVILKYMSHSAYKNIPAYRVAAMVAADDLQRIGAQKEREAQKKANDTQGGGTTVRKQSSGKVDWHTAPKAEFDAEVNRVLQRR